MQNWIFCFVPQDLSLFVHGFWQVNCWQMAEAVYQQKLTRCTQMDVLFGFSYVKLVFCDGFITINLFFKRASGILMAAINLAIKWGKLKLKKAVWPLFLSFLWSSSSPMGCYFRLVSFNSLWQGFMTIMHVCQNLLQRHRAQPPYLASTAVAPDPSKASDKASQLSPDVSWRVCKVWCWFIVDWNAIFIVSFDSGHSMSDFVKKTSHQWWPFSPLNLTLLWKMPYTYLCRKGHRFHLYTYL